MTQDSRPKCFVLMPLAGEFKEIYELSIKPAVESCGLACFRADELVYSGPILGQIIRSIYEAEIVIVDVSKANLNVFYELGISHALAKNVILIAQNIEDIPFDIRSYRVLIYQPSIYGVRKLQAELELSIKQALQSPIPTSPVTDFVPQTDTVPRSELSALEKEAKELEFLLASREAEIKALQTDRSISSDVTLLIDELKKHLDKIADDTVIRLQQEIAETRAHNERLKSEVELLQSAQRELRRLKNMMLVNPHWQGREFQTETDLCFLLMPFRESWSNDV